MEGGRQEIGENNPRIVQDLNWQKFPLSGYKILINLFPLCHFVTKASSSYLAILQGPALQWLVGLYRDRSQDPELTGPGSPTLAQRRKEGFKGLGQFR